MHNKKKLLIVFLFAINLLFLTCAKKNSLVIRKINDGESLTADILDLWTVGSGEEQEEFEETPSYSVEIEVSYFEPYGGPPRLSSFAHIKEYTVDFTDVTPLGEGGTKVQFQQKIRGGCSFFIEADPEGKKSEDGNITVLTREWILLYYEDLEEGKTLSATITLKGVDTGTGEDIEGKGSFLINIADFEDNPNTKGQ